MAPHAQGSTPEALIARIEAARGVLSAEVRTVRQRLDFPTRIKQSVLSKPLVWLGGSTAAGLAVSLLFRRRRQPKAVVAEEKKSGLLGFLMGSAFSLAKPALQAWAMKELRNRFAPAPQNSWERD